LNPERLVEEGEKHFKKLGHVVLIFSPYHRNKYTIVQDNFISDLELVFPRAVISDLESVFPHAVISDLESVFPRALISDLESVFPRALMFHCSMQHLKAPI